MTLDQAKQAQSESEAEFTKATTELSAARAAMQTAQLDLRSDDPTTPEKAAARDAAFHAARSRVASAEHAERHAAVRRAEARDRVIRLTPHAAALAKLAKAQAAVAAKDAAITALGLEMYARLAAEVRDLRALVAEADAMFLALPVEVRSADLSAPFTAAPSWGAVAAESPALLGRLDTAVYHRLGRWPNADDLKTRGARLGGVA